MTWTLSSGRVMQKRPGDWGAKALWLASDGPYFGGCSCCGEDAGGEDFTPSERREIAEAVKAAWDRWAETGEP